MSPAATLAANRTPILSLGWSLNHQSWLLDGRFVRFTNCLWTEGLAGLRIILVLACAMALEWHLAPLGIAGQAPVPVVASVVACYVLTSSYGRMVFACLAAGLFRDAFSSALPMGCSSLFFLLAAVVARELRDEVHGGRMAEQVLTGLLVAGTVVFLGHIVLVSSGVSGSAGIGEVLSRGLGGAFVAALVLTPLLRVAKILGGRGLRQSLRLLGAGTALLLAWGLRHLNAADRPVSDYPLPAQP